jgi:hypothetical protein
MPSLAHSIAYLGLSSIKTWAPKDLQGGIAMANKLVLRVEKQNIPLETVLSKQDMRILLRHVASEITKTEMQKQTSLPQF